MAIVLAVKVARITRLIKGKLALPPVHVLTVYMSIWPETPAEYSYTHRFPAVCVSVYGPARVGGAVVNL